MNLFILCLLKSNQKTDLALPSLRRGSTLGCMRAKLTAERSSHQLLGKLRMCSYGQVVRSSIVGSLSLGLRGHAKDQRSLLGLHLLLFNSYVGFINISIYKQLPVATEEGC